MRADFHVHSIYSKDSLSRPEKLLERAHALGLGKLIITDHNSLQGALAAAKLEPDYVIPGEEILTTSGEILALFVQEEIPKGLEPEKAFRLLREQGAFISLSHPYAASRHGWSESEMLRYLPYLDAIEIYNARNTPAQNQAASRFASAHGLHGTAGSDAHGLPELGRMGLELAEFRTADELRSAMRSAAVFGSESPFTVRFYSRFAVLRKKFNKNGL